MPTAVLALAGALLLAQVASADMRGQVVCGVAPDEAAVITSQTSSGGWHLWHTKGLATIAPANSEEAAFRRVAGESSFVCEVEIQVNFRRRGARFYRLGRKLRESRQTADGLTAGEFDVRKLIVGTPAPAARATTAPQNTCKGESVRDGCWMEAKNKPGCYIWTDWLLPEETATWDGQCVDGFAHGEGTVRREWLYQGEPFWEMATGTLVRGIEDGLWEIRRSNRTEAQGRYVGGLKSGNWTDETGRVTEYGSGVPRPLPSAR